jgi:hypothetical protein
MSRPHPTCRCWRTTGVPVFALSVFLLWPANCVCDSSREAATLARQILDDSRPENERKKIVADHPHLSLALLEALVADMPAHDTKEEYRRIPWIWRVTVAAAKRNDLRELKPIVEFTLPQMGKPLRDWQAVVLGGGIINGIGLVGAWPDEQIQNMVADDPNLRSRWVRTLALASEMADDPNVFNGTRYDALRIIGLDAWDRRGAQLCRYLKKGKGIDDELVQGAIGGLGTMRSPHVAAAILLEFPNYNQENRGFAVVALLKDSQRMSALLSGVEAGTVKRTDLVAPQITKLTHAADPEISARALRLFSRAGD